VIDGIKTRLPILEEIADYKQVEEEEIEKHECYQSIRPNFSLIVPGGVLRFMNSPTIINTPAVRGRVM
jgi:hypothetical protein